MRSLRHKYFYCILWNDVYINVNRISGDHANMKLEAALEEVTVECRHCWKADHSSSSESIVKILNIHNQL